MIWNMILILPSVFPSKLVTPITTTILTGICKCVFLAYLSDVFQEAAGGSQGPWSPSPVTGSVSFLVIRVILFSTILNFRVSASSNADALDSLSFLRVALNYWVSNDVSFFTLDALVWPVVIEAPRDTSSVGYTSLPNKYFLSPRSEISSPDESRASDALSSSGITNLQHLLV